MRFPACSADWLATRVENRSAALLGFNLQRDAFVATAPPSRCWWTCLACRFMRLSQFFHFLAVAFGRTGVGRSRDRDAVREVDVATHSRKGVSRDRFRHHYLRWGHGCWCIRAHRARPCRDLRFYDRLPRTSSWDELSRPPADGSGEGFDHVDSGNLAAAFAVTPGCLGRGFLGGVFCMGGLL